MDSWGLLPSRSARYFDPYYQRLLYVRQIGGGLRGVWGKHCGHQRFLSNQQLRRIRNIRLPVTTGVSGKLLLIYA